ncbi:hypothetical protein JXB41_08435 [Candidatus Woesearchaeota archaeon]|nr:hypothetical protein [Candidatus Woesearchaeota archaeon]
MKCLKCNKKSCIKISTNYFCKNCFTEVIQKRIRKELRITRVIKKNDKILIIDDGSYNSKNSVYLLKGTLKNLPCEISIKKSHYKIGKKIKTNANKIIIPWNLDDECEYFLYCFFNNKKPKYLGHYKLDKKLYIKLLLNVTDSESRKFADIKKFKYKKQKKEKSLINECLDVLEKEHPETKYSLLRSIEEIKKVYNEI